MEKLDKILITNLPSFYKINLYNMLSKKCNLLVIFTVENGGILRNDDFFNKKPVFKHYFLQGNILSKGFQICKIIFNNKYKELILGGWDSFPNWLAALCFTKEKNSLIIESSHWESQTKGIKGLLKSIFLMQVSKVYGSGKAQSKLLTELNFKGKIVITKGVGIFNIVKQPSYNPVINVTNFLFVGRLSPEKNLINLINSFKKLPKLKLTIVGFGPQENELKNLASQFQNILFEGAIENKLLPKIYQNNHVFILPSKSEPWGLVVEEAFNNGLPVIVSDRVGCSDEIVIENENGIVFLLEQQNSLEKAILKMTDVQFYNKLRKNIASMDFYKNAEKQVNSYIN